jgi:2-dehydro-3-deoxyphosphogluconate aldolase/(4S)-4-hydroxy-2-oxoglutarate aldolase
VATASEIMQAVVRKLSAVKFFPAGVLGGTAAISALSAPFPGLKFVPMGGVSAANMAEYLRLPAVHAIGGSWLVGSELVSAGKFSEVTRLVREALDIYKEARRV